jgi:membrane protein DedA with SNARE-associated domain
MPDWLSHLSYLGIVIVLILTGAGLPIPEEVPVIAAGVASSNQQMDPWLALAACLFGAIVGDCIMYSIGYHFGRGLLRDRHWFARAMTPEKERQIEKMIARHGWKVFLVARFLVGLRSPVYLTAGILRVPFRRFLLIDALVASVVVSTFFGLSYTYAAHIETLWKWIHNSQYALTALLVVAGTATLICWLVWRRRRRLADGSTSTLAALHDEAAAPRKTAV